MSFEKYDKMSCVSKWNVHDFIAEKLKENRVVFKEFFIERGNLWRRLLELKFVVMLVIM